MTNSTNRIAAIIFSIHARTWARSGAKGEVIGGLDIDHGKTPRPSSIGPAVADIDGDDRPEVIYPAAPSVFVIEHDGTLGPTYGSDALWSKPAAIHDIDGDMQPDVIAPGNVLMNNMVGAGFLALFVAGGPAAWTVPTQDGGNAGATAFDFLGDGKAEAIYADEVTAIAFDDLGNVSMSVARSSYTNIEYPVVADVDNDGSAEFVVVSNVMPGLAQTAPAVRLFGDADDRWVGARRIWNQHTYHVTNVREDGSIPQHEPPHWRSTNTFRTQAQLESGSVCVPVPAG